MDFYDKLVISITCIIVTFICVFNTFCFASENVDYLTVSNLQIDENTSTFSPANSVVGYFPLEVGYKYTITIPSSWSTDRKIALSSEVPSVGVSLSFISYLSPGNSFTYSCYDTSEYLYFDISSANDGLIITRDSFSSFSNVIFSLSNNVGIENLWNVFETSTPYIAVVVIVAFGFYIIFTMIRKISKGKSRL